MIKKYLPYLLAVLVFFIALALLRPPEQTQVAVAAVDLPAGHILTEGDLVMKGVPADLLPPEGAITDPAVAVGQALRIDRSAGDLILTAHLGEKPVTLQPDERAVAIQVSDSAGLAGIIRPGDRVGVTAILTDGDYTVQGVFSKATVENLRVLYIQPSFQAEDPAEAAGQIITPDPQTGIAVQRQRSKEGVVVLAVPAKAQAVVYDFQSAGIEATTAVRLVNAVELLSALDQADNVKLSLYLMPDEAQPMNTSGLWLPELVIRQMTPTPTPTPVGFAAGQ
uniref:Flp pilus assembly protein CpaB n=1 Tax=Bellilinea caldifistulae TaxID=360411 RepID=A0A7C4Q3L7_9CHLR